MTRVMTLLAFWQMRNAVRTTFTDYRKLVPLAAIVFFIGMQVVSSIMLAGSRPTNLPGMEEAILEQAETIRTVAFLILALISVGIIDYGFQEGFLAFSLADVDYLFPSPVPRRLILAYRLGAKTLQSVFQASFLFYFLVWRLVIAVAPDRAGPGPTLLAFAGLLFCLGGYASLAFALKMIFGFGRLQTVRRWTMGAVILVLALFAYTFWKHGIRGLTNISENAVVMGAFYPCRLAAEGMTAPLLRESSVLGVVQLGLFYVLATFLLFTRNENFYEASLEGSERHARLLAAAKEQNWSAIFAIQSEKRRKGPQTRTYAFPPFGQGGMALFWANLAAAAKRPAANFWMPLLGGIGIATICTLFAGQYSAFVAGGFTCYLLFILTMSSMALYRQSIARQPLIRPLPFQPWQVVIADILPRTLMASLFVWGSGFVVLFFSDAQHHVTVGSLLVLCVPAALLVLNVVQYILALWYPDAQDKFQQLLAGFISLFLTTGTISLMSLALILPMVLHAPVALTALIFLVPTFAVAGLLLLWASAAYRRFQPKQ